jgi:hypothetical protein
MDAATATGGDALIRSAGNVVPRPDLCLGFPYYRRDKLDRHAAPEGTGVHTLWYDPCGARTPAEAHNTYPARDLGHYLIPKLYLVQPRRFVGLRNGESDSVIDCARGPFSENLTMRVVDGALDALWLSLGREEATRLRAMWIAVWTFLHGEEDAVLAVPREAWRHVCDLDRDAYIGALGSRRAVVRHAREHEECRVQIADLDASITALDNDLRRIVAEESAAELLARACADERALRLSRYRMRRGVHMTRTRLKTLSDVHVRLSVRATAARYGIEEARAGEQRHVSALVASFDAHVAELLALSPPSSP